MTAQSIKMIRYLVAYVFIISGLMKIFSEGLGGFFISLGLPFPMQLMYLVAVTEIICGGLLLANKWVKTATIPLLCIMVAALILTKIPALKGSVMEFAFDARLDIVMIGLLMILYNRYPK